MTYFIFFILLGIHVDTTSQEESDSFIFSPGGGIENDYACIEDNWDTMVLHQESKTCIYFFQSNICIVFLNTTRY